MSSISHNLTAVVCHMKACATRYSYTVEDTLGGRHDGIVLATIPKSTFCKHVDALQEPLFVFCYFWNTLVLHTFLNIFFHSFGPKGTCPYQTHVISMFAIYRPVALFPFDFFFRLFLWQRPMRNSHSSELAFTTVIDVLPRRIVLL